MKKNGYILLETIVVLTILGGLLVTLYLSFNKIILKSKEVDNYNNTEYLYKANYARNLMYYSTLFNQQIIYWINQNNTNNEKKAILYKTSDEIMDSMPDVKEDLKAIGVYKIFIIPGDYDYDGTRGGKVEASAEKFIKYLKSSKKPSSNYKIVFMFVDENKLNLSDFFDESNTESNIKKLKVDNFQYASLDWGIRDYD